MGNGGVASRDGHRSLKLPGGSGQRAAREPGLHPPVQSAPIISGVGIPNRRTSMQFQAALVTTALVCVSVSRASAQSEVERLASLGKVWGFLKYYHPGVAAGPIDWDSVLVA